MSLGIQFSQNCRVEQAILAANGAAGQTKLTGAITDMQGFDGLFVLVNLGAFAGGGACTLKLQGGNKSDGSDMADIADTGQTGLAAANTYYVDMVRPQYRYFQIIVDRTGGSGNVTVQDATYIKYGNRRGPESQGTNVSGEYFSGPAAGTA